MYKKILLEFNKYIHNMYVCVFIYTNTHTTHIILKEQKLCFGIH